MALRRPCLAGLAFLLVTAGCGAAAGDESEPFSEARFRALQPDGALVLVDVAADWCPTCAMQAKRVQRHREERPDVPLHVPRVDFDEQKQWVRCFEAPRQSTLILYRGTARVWFSVAETDATAITNAIDEAESRRDRIHASTSGSRRVPRTIPERAWTSPVWYPPGS